MATTTVAYHECDSCGQSCTGYTQRELQNAGWVWHEVKDGLITKATFVMCSDCEHEYERRREVVALVQH